MEAVRTKAAVRPEPRDMTAFIRRLLAAKATLSSSPKKEKPCIDTTQWISSREKVKEWEAGVSHCEGNMLFPLLMDSLWHRDLSHLVVTGVVLVTWSHLQFIHSLLDHSVWEHTVQYISPPLSSFVLFLNQFPSVQSPDTSPPPCSL